MPNPPRKPLSDQSPRTLQINELDQSPIKLANDLLAILPLQRRARDHGINPGQHHRLNNLMHRKNPRRTIEISKRLPAMHLALALLAMKIVAVAKFPPKRRTQRTPNR